MKITNMNRYMNKILTLLLAVVCLGTFTACDDDDPVAEVNEGVIFTLTRKLVYTTGVNEIGSIKITLSDGKEKIVLPSLPLKGDEEMVRSEPCALAAGDYRIVAYTAYSTRHEFLFDAELDSKNEFTVGANEVVEFKIPIKTKEILNFNFLRNALMGLCQQVFGDDDSTWPWNPKKYPYPDWEGLEFELDDYGSPMYLSGISFEGLKDGKPTPWAQMTAIPDGTLSNIAELATIQVSDIPGFKHLPADLDRLPGLQQISCINTGIEELPDNLSQLTTLSGIFLINGQVRDFAYDLSPLKELRVLSLSGNQLERFAVPTAGLGKLISLDLSHNPLQTLDEACFSGQTVLNQLNLSHTRLSSLPASLGQEQTLRGLDLSGCQFTAVPAVLRGMQLKRLSLEANPLTALQPADLSGMTTLESLSLAGNALGTLSVLPLPQLAWLDVQGCGLTQAPDCSAYPGLRALFLGNNRFSTLPEGCFAANPRLTVLQLSQSPELTALPADLGLQAVDAAGHEAFRLLEVEQCPRLHWTAPAGWQAYDFNHSNDWLFQPGADTVDEIQDAVGTDDFGRVGIRRSGSPYVRLAP